MILIRIQIKGIPEAGKNRHQGSREKSAEQHAGGQLKKEALSGNGPCKPTHQQNNQYQKNAAAKRAQKPHDKGHPRVQRLKCFRRKHLGILSGHQKGKAVLSHQLQILIDCKISPQFIAGQ